MANCECHNQMVHPVFFKKNIRDPPCLYSWCLRKNGSAAGQGHILCVAWLWDDHPTGELGQLDVSGLRS